MKIFKKTGTFLLSALLMIALAVCSSQAEAQESASESSPEAGTDSLVVYFSRTGEQYGVGEIDKGNTAIVADMIIDKTGADSFEILSEEDYYPYTYDELTDVAKQEQNENARPVYAGEVPDFAQYSDRDPHAERKEKVSADRDAGRPERISGTGIYASDDGLCIRIGR